MSLQAYCTQITDDELMITAGGREYDELFNMQWNLSDIDDKENKDPERDTEVTGDANNDARKQGTPNERIGTILKIQPQKKKGIRKALKDKIIGSLERTAKLVGKEI